MAVGLIELPRLHVLRRDTQLMLVHRLQKSLDALCCRGDIGWAPHHSDPPVSHLDEVLRRKIPSLGVRNRNAVALPSLRPSIYADYGRHPFPNHLVIDGWNQNDAGRQERLQIQQIGGLFLEIVVCVA